MVHQHLVSISNNVTFSSPGASSLAASSNKLDLSSWIYQRGLIKVDLSYQIGFIKVDLSYQMGLIKVDLSYQIGLIKVDLSYQIGLIKVDLSNWINQIGFIKVD